jgi:hypothetical protein
LCGTKPSGSAFGLVGLLEDVLVLVPVPDGDDGDSVEVLGEPVCDAVSVGPPLEAEPAPDVPDEAEDPEGAELPDPDAEEAPDPPAAEGLDW